MGTILGALITRTIVYLGLYRGPLVLGNYHLSVQAPDRPNLTLAAIACVSDKYIPPKNLEGPKLNRTT